MPSSTPPSSSPPLSADPVVPLYDRNFLFALLSQTCFVCANTLMAHYARWIEFLGGGLKEIGWIMGSTAMFGLLLRPWMAQWINRLGARSMWRIGYAIFACAALSNLFLEDLGPAIYLARGSLVMGVAIVFASGLTYITQTTPELRRTEAIGIFGIGGFFGMMAGPLIGDLFLRERTESNFAALFIAATIACGIPMLGIGRLRATPVGGKATTVSVGEFFANAKRYWPGSILLVDLAFGVCMASPFVFLASFIDQARLHLPGVSMIGLFFFCYAGIATVVRLGSRRMPDRIGDRKVLLIGMAFMSVGMFCFAVVDSAAAWLIIVPALLTGTGHGLMFHTMTSLTLQSFPSQVRGTGSALALMMLDLGTLAGAPALGIIGDEFGYAALFASIGTFCLLNALIYAATSQER